MPYILYVILVASGGSSATIDSQEFASRAACEAAATEVVSTFRALPTTARPKAFCIAQGDNEFTIQEPPSD